MPAWPDSLQTLFDRAAARLRMLAVADAVSVALILSVPVLVARLMGALSTPASVAWAIAAAALASAVAVWRSPRTADALAAAIESRTPIAHNLFVTAAELAVRARPIRADVRDVVFRDAADAAQRVDVPALFPGRRSVLMLLITTLVWVAALSVDRTWIARAREIVGVTGSSAPAIGRVVITITPPAYAGRAVQTLADPERIDALSGSAIHIEVEASADHVDLFGAGERRPLASSEDRRALARGGDRVFRGDITASADGFLAVQPFGSGDAAGVRRVISLAVVPDRPPVARIVVPGKDLFLSAASSTVSVKIEASDDIGLASLQLTFTRVRGSGENFEFKDGEFPLHISRATPLTWAATTSIALSTMSLEAGDLLVYRAVVADTRPGATPIESDALVVQIIRPGEALSEGFAIDETTDKYAISQQMVIIKTERLIAKKPTLSAEAFSDQAQTIAAEQRKVRAEFVFMMGGEFEDAAGTGEDLNEEEEAANEAELLAGRMQNNGRRDIILATRRMSNAAQLLTNIDPVKALPHEKAALDALQRAFTRSRYILRVLTPRERIDDARRLSGKLGDVTAWRRPIVEAPANPRAAALVAALSRVSRVAALPQYGSTEANELAGIAEAILRVDATLSAVAQPFAQAAAAIAAGTSARETAAMVDKAAAALAALARQSLSASPAVADPSRARLQGALADALNKLKRGGGRP